MVVLRFAAVYGFRNIQTLMRKIKSGRCEYHYVEVMACPSGPHRVTALPAGQHSTASVMDQASLFRPQLRCSFHSLSDTCLLEQSGNPRLSFIHRPFNVAGAGCLNGGGQLKPQQGQTQQQLIAALDETYHHADIVPRPPEANLVRSATPCLNDTVSTCLALPSASNDSRPIQALRKGTTPSLEHFAFGDRSGL